MKLTQRGPPEPRTHHLSLLFLLGVGFSLLYKNSSFQASVLSLALALVPFQLPRVPSPPSPFSQRRVSAIRSEMDDSCAVCADSLDWVAYGSCGHREVCSTCVVRLRVVIGDCRCCICKTESPIVFVTKVLIDRFF